MTFLCKAHKLIFCFKFFYKAEILDAAAGVHIKFRLAGVSIHYTCFHLVYQASGF